MIGKYLNGSIPFPTLLSSSHLGHINKSSPIVSLLHPPVRPTCAWWSVLYCLHLSPSPCLSTASSLLILLIQSGPIIPPQFRIGWSEAYMSIYQFAHSWLIQPRPYTRGAYGTRCSTPEVLNHQNIDSTSDCRDHVLDISIQPISSRTDFDWAYQQSTGY